MKKFWLLLCILFLSCTARENKNNIQINENIYNTNEFFTINNVKYGFNIEKYTFSEVSRVSNFGSNSHWFLPYNIWDIYEYKNDKYSVFKYNYNWYKIITYIFENEDVFLNGCLNIDASYDDMINVFGQPIGIVKSRGTDNIFQYGELFPATITGSIANIEFVFRRNKLIQIRYNIIEIVIDEIISDLIVNEWKSYPTHSPQWIVEYFTNNKFVFKVKDTIEEEYKIFNGNYEVYKVNNIPVVRMFNFDGNEVFNGEYYISRRERDRYAIDINGLYYFFPELLF